MRGDAQPHIVAAKCVTIIFKIIVKHMEIFVRWT